jgi:steroid 5-alpha reductase family enzyme
MGVVQMILFGWLGMALMMAVLYGVARINKNAGIVDAGWATGLAILAVVYALAADGLAARRLLLAALAGFWGLRLGSYLFFNRFLGRPEDGRYRELRRRWGHRAERNFFLFFQFQAGLDVLFSLPFLAVACNAKPALDALDLLGALVWALAVLGETKADRQLARFRARPENRGKTCSQGLWRYSRHPNYFFEWIHWFAYILLGVGSPLWWLTLLGPVLMALFLLKITGIPYTEQQSLKSKGDSYREYQRTTSPFIPWFPKKPRRSGP